MTTASKPVTINKLSAFKKAQRKVLTPLPAALLQQAGGTAFSTLSEKAEELPEFIDFHPLEAVSWEPLESASPHLEDTPEEAIKRRMVSAFQNKAHLHPTAGASRFQHDKKSNRPDERGITPQKLSLVNSGNKDRVLKEKSSAQSESAFTKTDSNSRTGTSKQVISPSHTNAAPQGKNKPSPDSLLRQPVTYILATLLNSIESLNQSLAPSENGQTGPTNAPDRIRRQAPKSTGGNNTERNLTGAAKKRGKVTDKPVGSVQGTISERSLMIANPNQSLQTSRSSSGVSGNSSFNTLDTLVNQLWLFSAPKDGTSNTFKNTARSTDASGQQELNMESSPNALANQGLPSSVKSRSALDIPELQVDVPDHLAEIPHTRPAYTQAEELAEQINRVLREQAWLRGVNLP